MADITHDASDDGFHEIQLSGKQLVFLFMATTVVSVVIFLCGVLVGRGVRAQQLLSPEAADPPVAAAPAPTDTVAEAGPPAAEPPTPPAEPPTPPAEVSETAEKPSTEKVRPSEEESKPPATAESSPPPVPAPVASAPPSPSRSPRASRASTRDSWVVQIVALRDRGMASSIVQRLNGKGYPAFVVNPTAGTPAPVFKVQVGRYADRDEAEQVARRLEKEEQFKPWVSR